MSYKNKLVRVAILCYLPIVVLFATIRMLSAFGLLNFLNNFFGNLGLNLIIQVGLLFVMSIFLFAKMMKCGVTNVFKFYGFKKIRTSQVLLAVLMGVIVYFLNVFITTFFNGFLSALGYKFSSGSASASYPFWLFLINIIFTAVLPAVCEETAHRGMLLNGFGPLGAKKALIYSSLFFGLLHLNIEQVFYATLIGLFVGYVAMRSESIYPAIIIHFMNNFISVLMGYSSFHNLGLDFGFNVISSWLSNTPLLAISFMIILIIALFMLLKVVLRRYLRISALDKMNEMQDLLLYQYERERYFKQVENLLNEDEKPLTESKLQEQFFQNFNMQYELAKSAKSDINFNMLNDKSEFKLNLITKILIWTTFAIVSVLTLFTLIWGIL